MNSPWPSHLLILMLSAALIVACGTKNSQRPVVDSGIENLTGFEPSTYWNVWKGDPSLPDQFLTPISEEQWASLVRESENSGLLRMNESRRRDLLVGAAKAYLRSVGGTRRRIELADGRGHADVTEFYQRDEEGLYLLLSKREQEATDIRTEWSDLAYMQPNSTAIIRDFAHGEAEMESWNSEDGGATWSCEVQQGHPSAFGNALYYVDLVNVMIDGKPVREETYGGRTAVVIKSTTGQEIWIDKASLFPVFYTLNADPGGAPKRTVKILALNPDVEVERPRSSCS